MNKQTPYSKENEYKNNSEPSANRALPPSGELEGALASSIIANANGSNPCSRAICARVRRLGLYGR